jgi:hypothetical protein
MPARKRHKKAEEHRDPVARFADALKRSEAREQAERERRRAARVAAERAAERAEALRVARVELDAAIERVRVAHRDRRGRDEADAAWRAAKARVIELETGAPPTWTEG